MFEDDQSYFQHRAEIEIGRAERASSPGAVQAHYKLAEAYLEKVATLDHDRQEQA